MREEVQPLRCKKRTRVPQRHGDGMAAAAFWNGTEWLFKG